ncbi:hypothetical protein CJF31_00009080 [Rutstroemia sp. NJR-2017a BVV2]|nr:hypothetical protein CJF31_00009080 [Rutstroemia sp. NJR-2017a BVV2]
MLFNAKTAGMQKDLKLTSAEYQWLLTIFYIAYIVFEWFALMWKVIPPHMWACFCVVGWGTVATLQSATYSWSGMMTARFFLGFFEAGYGPGIPYLLSFFYLRHEIGVRIGFFLSAAPLATCFAGALAYGITSGDGSAIANWRLLFLVEGLPCVLAGIATYFILPDSPEKARFLNEEEKLVAKARGVRQVGAEEEEHRVGRISFADIGAALIDPKNYLTAMMYFSCNVSFSSLPVFLPTILNEMGFSAVNAQGLSAPPYFLAFLLVILSTYIADRTQQRGLVIICLSALGAVGYILLATTSAVGPRYTGVFLAAAGIFPCISNILPWVLNNQGSDTKRGTGIALLNLIGQCGPLLGTRLYPAEESPFYRKGMWVCTAFMIFNGFLALALRTLLAWENKRLDEKYGKVGRRDGDGNEVVGAGVMEDDKTQVGAGVGVGDENDGPRFRFLRALFPQHFTTAHRNKRVKYTREGENECEIEIGTANTRKRKRRDSPETEVEEEKEEEEEVEEQEESEKQIGKEAQQQIGREDLFLLCDSVHRLERSKMAKQLVIDPDGDLVLVLKERTPEKATVKGKEIATVRRGLDDSAISLGGVSGEEGDDEEDDDASSVNTEVPFEPREIFMLVSSKHMMLVSAVFKAMLQHGNFSEGAALRFNGKAEVPLPEDDPDALKILVDVIHSRHKHVPKKVDLDLLTHVAILVDKYRLHEAVELYSDIWIKGLLPTVPKSIQGGDAVLQWLCIAWVFELEEEFAKMSRVLMAEGCDSAENILRRSKWDLPIPDSVIELIESERQCGLNTATSVLKLTIEQYQTSTSANCSSIPASSHSSPTAAEILAHRERCDSMVLGSLIREAVAAGLYPLPQAPYTGFSNDGFYRKLEAFRIWNGCEGIEVVPRKTGRGKMHLSGKELTKELWRPGVLELRRFMERGGRGLTEEV